MLRVIFISDKNLPKSFIASVEGILNIDNDQGRAVKSAGILHIGGRDCKPAFFTLLNGIKLTIKDHYEKELTYPMIEEKKIPKSLKALENVQSNCSRIKKDDEIGFSKIKGFIPVLMIAECFVILEAIILD